MWKDVKVSIESVEKPKLFHTENIWRYYSSSHFGGPTWILTDLTVDARFARYWIPAVQAATQIPRSWKGERPHCTALSETFKKIGETSFPMKIRKESNLFYQTKGHRLFWSLSGAARVGCLVLRICCNDLARFPGTTGQARAGKNEALGCFQVEHLLMQILFTWSFMVSRLEQIDAVLQATAPTSIQKLAKKKNLTRFTWFLYQYQVEKSLSSDNGFNLRRANQKLFLPTLAVFLTMIRCFAKEVFLKFGGTHGSHLV